MLRVLIVEDSPVVQNLIAYVLESDGDFIVAGIAENGADAVRLAASLRPDVISMDVNLPGFDGLEATRRIMSASPAPIVICSGDFNPKNVQATFQALQAGAVAVVEKPHSFGSPDFSRIAAQFKQSLRLMAEVKVFQRKKYSTGESLTPASEPAWRRRISQMIRTIGIGASTGGPDVIQFILSNLNEDFAIPILLVQHIANGFTRGFVDWLNATAKISVKIAEDNEPVKGGVCYVAPEGFHLTLSPARRVVFDDSPPLNGSKPAIGMMLKSLTAHEPARSAGILLTGMGRDGAAELKQLRDLGGLTIAQDEDSSLIYGIPKEAAALDAVQFALKPKEMVTMLNHLNFLSP